IGTPQRPVERRDKNVRTWYMTIARLFMYLLDALHLAFVLATRSKAHAEVLIFDRYEYDELANLDLRNSMTRAYAKILLKLIPRPDVALLLDVDPVIARARKPEYPLEFLSSIRGSYLELARLSKSMTVIPPLPVEAVTRLVLQEVSRSLPKARSGTIATNRVSHDRSSQELTSS